MSVSNAPTPRVTVLRPEVNQPDMADGNTSVRPRLLIVDDISDNRVILTRRFQRRGFDVVEAECGLSSMKYSHREPFALVLLDVLMPGTDGIEIRDRTTCRIPRQSLAFAKVTAKSESGNVVD